MFLSLYTDYVLHHKTVYPASFIKTADIHNKNQWYYKPIHGMREKCKILGIRDQRENIDK